MKRTILLSVGLFVCACGSVWADTFGAGAYQFDIEFVTISGNASSANGTNISQHSSGERGYKTFSDPGDYRMGVHEITNEQWDKFKVNLGVPVTGWPHTSSYDEDAYFTGAKIPTNNVSWWEAAQFVNWLNTSTGHQSAYKFVGTQGTIDYHLREWELGDNGYNPQNPYRNSNAYYFLPTEEEWVKAAYWNGTNLQTYATSGDTVPVEDVDANYGFVSGSSYPYGEPWDVGSGSVELNGTFDMMGNVWEWTESQ